MQMSKFYPTLQPCYTALAYKVPLEKKKNINPTSIISVYTKQIF